MELSPTSASQIPQAANQEGTVNSITDELNLLRQHVDNGFARQREYIDLLVDREREHVGRLLAETREAIRMESDAKNAELRRDLDRKFMWMIAILVGVIAGQVALFFR